MQVIELTTHSTKRLQVISNRREKGKQSNRKRLLHRCLIWDLQYLTAIPQINAHPNPHTTHPDHVSPTQTLTYPPRMQQNISMPRRYSSYATAHPTRSLPEGVSQQAPSLLIPSVVHNAATWHRAPALARTWFPSRTKECTFTNRSLIVASEAESPDTSLTFKSSRAH